MTSFYYFVYRLGRRFAYYDILMQTPSGMAEFDLSQDEQKSFFSLKERLFRALHPIEFALSSASATKKRIKYTGVVRTGVFRRKLIPVHIFVSRKEVEE